jgi:hypothetical protein
VGPAKSGHHWRQGGRGWWLEQHQSVWNPFGCSGEGGSSPDGLAMAMAVGWWGTIGEGSGQRLMAVLEQSRSGVALGRCSRRIVARP